MRMFIADDSALLRRQLIELLRELEGLEIVGQAEGVGQALEAIRVLRPDVITLDIQMSDGNGLDLLRQIKKESPALWSLCCPITPRRLIENNANGQGPIFSLTRQSKLTK